VTVTRIPFKLPSAEADGSRNSLSSSPGLYSLINVDIVLGKLFVVSGILFVVIQYVFPLIPLEPLRGSKTPIYIPG